jgi:DNA recombination protein RmuC
VEIWNLIGALVVGALVGFLVRGWIRRGELAASLARQRAELETVGAARVAALEERATRIPALEAELAAARAECNRIERELTDARIRNEGLQVQGEEERKAAAGKLELLADAQVRLRETFQALSAEALHRSAESFLQLAGEAFEKHQATATGALSQREAAIRELLQPLRESLAGVDLRIADIEKQRVGAYESLLAQIRALGETQGLLRQETGRLVQALRSPIVRGRWGEIQLRRVVELAGMLKHCDFFEQEQADSDAGRLRPDLLVRLPAGRTIVVDAKAPLAAYLEAVEAQDEGPRNLALDRHARRVREHIDALSRKAYWEQFQPAPEFVILFLPGEAFFAAALERDPELIEYGVRNRVILATPTTLIALLQAVYHGWRQEALEENARKISELGRELYKRICDFGQHLDRVGRGLGNAIDAYNKAVGTLESRVLVSARRFRELEGDTGAPEPSPDALDQSPRRLQAPEWEPGGPPGAA